MRLLFITGSLVHGGAERHTITLANRLAERGHECHLAYIKDDSSQLGRLRGAASVRCLHARRYLDLGALKQLAALMARVQPTSVVAVNQYPLLYATLARRWVGRTGPNLAPLTVTFHSTFVQGAKEQLKMLYYRPLFWNADCLAFVCEAQRRHWLARMVSARRNEVIYNGVDLEYWRPGGSEERTTIRRVVGLADTDYAIGMCAVLRPEKNHLQLVDAIAALRRRGIAARALLIGDGPQRGAIEARARAAGVSADVVITGFQQDVRPFVAACDVLAITSVTEALSLAGGARAFSSRSATTRCSSTGWPCWPIPTRAGAWVRGRARPSKRASRSARCWTATKACCWKSKSQGANVKTYADPLERINRVTKKRHRP